MILASTCIPFFQPPNIVWFQGFEHSQIDVHIRMLFLESDEEFELHIWKSEKSDALEAEQDPSSANVRSTVNENINTCIQYN
jgi:hypothetical protein